MNDTSSPVPPLVIFLSAVSREFHLPDPERRVPFQSYRDCLHQELRALGGVSIVVQEDLHQGGGDLLQTLDREIAKSELVVHLIGDMAGEAPVPAERRLLRERHPDFLHGQPELRDALGEGTIASYTQWELYLAYHHGLARYEFAPAEDAPRSPCYQFSAADRALQDQHLERLRLTGERPATFHSALELFVLVNRALHRDGYWDRRSKRSTTPEAIAAARADIPGLVQQVAQHLRQPDPRLVTLPTPGGSQRIDAAYRLTAEAHELTTQSLIQILEAHDREQTAAVEAAPSVQGYHGLALLRLALAEYTQAMAYARKAADMALAELRHTTIPDFRHMVRQSALNALLLYAHAARLAHHNDLALKATEEGGTLIDRHQEPQLWAAYHHELAQELDNHGHYACGLDLIREVREVRERYPGEQNDDLIRTLLLMSELLHRQGNAKGAEVVADLALRLADEQQPQHLPNLAACCAHLAQALDAQRNHAEAETWFRQALEIETQELGANATNTLAARHELARCLDNQGLRSAAEAEYRAVLEKVEIVLGPVHPHTLTTRHALASCLDNQGQHSAAEVEFQAVLEKRKLVLGPEHPDTLRTDYWLALCLHHQGRAAEALAVLLPAQAAQQRVLGPDHPDTQKSTLLRQVLEAALAEQDRGGNAPVASES